MKEPEKITIVEGPPPAFELVADSWAMGLTEGPWPSRAALCRVRTFNGPELVERCVRAWGQGEPITLEYRTEDGLTEQAPIVAARHVDTTNGDMLMIWVRMEEEIEIEIDFDLDEIDLDELDELDEFDEDDIGADFDIDL